MMAYIFTPEAEFVTKVSYMKEKMKTREHEIWGRWMTEHAMKKSSEFSPQGIRSIISYCNKFPETLIRLDFWMGIIMGIRTL